MFRKRHFAIVLFISFTTFLIGSVATFYYLFAFSSQSIAPALPHSEIAQNDAIPASLTQIFDSPLSYLGEGNQAYAFVTSDNKYVVKFFKRGPIEGHHWWSLLPNIDFVQSWLSHRLVRQQYKFQRIFNAYDVAYRLDRDHCGLLWIHLHQTDSLHTTATVINGLGISHQIDLDKVAFVIQKRGEPLRNVLKEYLQHDDVQAATEALQQVLAMYVDEYRHGIFDHDHNLMYNVGFAEDQPIRLDVGKLVHDPIYSSPEVFQSDLDKIINQRIAKWLKRYAADHSSQIMDSLQNIKSTNESE